MTVKVYVGSVDENNFLNVVVLYEYPDLASVVLTSENGIAVPIETVQNLFENDNEDESWPTIQVDYIAEDEVSAEETPPEELRPAEYHVYSYTGHINGYAEYAEDGRSLGAHLVEVFADDRLPDEISVFVVSGYWDFPDSPSVSDV